MKLAVLSVLAVFAVPSIALACGDKAKTVVACAEHAKMQEASAGGPMCDHHGKTVVAVNNVSLKDVAAWNKSRKITPVDANSAETRAKMGVIPGAKLLSSSSQYAATELPASKDAKLVFYCASTRCTASQKAAKRAVELGYTDVNVLPDGIKGWVEAGQPTDRITPRS